MAHFAIFRGVFLEISLKMLYAMKGGNFELVRGKKDP